MLDGVADTRQLSRASRLLRRPALLGGRTAQGLPSQSARPREEEIGARTVNGARYAHHFSRVAGCFVRSAI